MKTDIILPTLKVKSKNNTNIIKVIKDINNYVIYLSRGNIPFEYKDSIKQIDKHLSIISFLPSALEKFAMCEKTPLEKIEDIELLRALEIGLKIKYVNFLPLFKRNRRGSIKNNFLWSQMISIS